MCVGVVVGYVFVRVSWCVIVCVWAHLNSGPAVAVVALHRGVLGDRKR